MARTTLNYKVTDENRDYDKVFVITEMSAFRAEAWALRVLMALLKGNVELPEGFERMGMAGIAQIGFKLLAGLKYEIAEPLLAEMLSCVQYMPDKNKPMIVRPIMEAANDIEEITTILKLRAEVFKLHTGFLKAVAPSLFQGKAAAGGTDSPNT